MFIYLTFFIKTMTKLKDEYVIDCVLGEGAAGRVYLARKPIQRTDIFGNILTEMMRVAIKESPLLTSTAHEDKLAIQCIRDEATYTNQLGVTSVSPTVFDEFEESGRLYSVREYISGCTLENRISVCYFTEDEALTFATHLTKAISHIHNAKLVYNDLKPDNVILTPDPKHPNLYSRFHKNGLQVAVPRYCVEDHGTTRILDFGITFEEGDLSDIAAEKMGMDTYEFSATEKIFQRRDDRRRDIDRRSDIYSMGILLKYAISGQRPEVPNFPWKMTKELAPDFQDIFAQVIDKACEYDPRNRYQTAEALLKDLDKVREEKAQSQRRAELRGSFESQLPTFTAIYDMVARNATAILGQMKHN